MRLTNRTGVLLFPILVAAAGGCSTLSRGPSQTVTFQTDAADAVVHVGKETLQAPARVELSRHKTYTILVEAPGRRPVKFEMKPRFDGISLGNLIYPGGSIGMLTDFLTGADKKFKPVPTIALPRLDTAKAGEPTMVLLHQHDGQLMTGAELARAKQGG